MAQKFLSKGKKKLKAKPKAANKHGRKRSERTLKKGAGCGTSQVPPSPPPPMPARLRPLAPCARLTGGTAQGGRCCRRRGA